MPIYEYYCKHCGAISEENVSMAERDIAFNCDCGKMKNRKVSFTGVVYSATANGGMK